MFHQQVLILRAQQHVVNELMKIGKLKIGPHMAFGHEANAIALKNIFKKGDDLILTHRNIAYNLAFDTNNFKKFIDEFNLKKKGINEGKNGSMNIINPSKGINYTSSILGNNFSVALGISLSKKFYKSKNSFTYVITGDGAMEEGTFIETLIISRKFNLNFIIIIENNDFAMASTIKERRCEINLKKVAEAYDINYTNLNSRKVDEYVFRINKFKNQILKSKKPGIIEINTKMFNRHAGPTPGWPSDPLNIDFKKGLIIHNSFEDPVYNSIKKVKKNIQEKIFNKYKKLNFFFKK